MPTDEHRAVATKWLRQNLGMTYAPHDVDSLATLIAEREAAARAVAIEEAAGIALRVARENSKLAREMDAHDLLSAQARARAISVAMHEVERQIRALTPDPALVVVRSGDLRHAVGACGCTKVVISSGDSDTSEPWAGWHLGWPDEHRAAVERVAALARMGESDASQ